MATVLSDIVVMFGSYISLLASLLVVSGVSVLSVLVAITLFRLVVNLIRPAFSVASGINNDIEAENNRKANAEARTKAIADWKKAHGGKWY